MNDFLFFSLSLFWTLFASGMDVLNGAIDTLIGSSSREDWTQVALNVADATVTISKDKVRLVTSVYIKSFFHCHTWSDLFYGILLYPIKVTLFLKSHILIRMNRKFWWSAVYVFCRSWVLAVMCTPLPSLWMPVAIGSTAMSCGVSPTLAVYQRLSRQRVW